MITHLGIIADGNRRWAKEQGLPSIEGHKKGLEAIEKLVDGAAKAGIKYISFYVFSTENWGRSAEEVGYLMKLIKKKVFGLAKKLKEKNGKMVCALSGSPVSSLMNFYALALPALKKFAGLHNYMPEEVEVTLRTDFKRRGSGPLLLNGKLDFSGGTVGMVLPGKQGNTVSEDIQNLGIFTVVPADVDFIAAGTILRGIRI